jgi:tetratricopeptide (TPR) repeat protein
MMARAVGARVARTSARAAVLALLFACASPPLEQRPWLEVQSAGFTLYTDLDREQALALSGDAELFRAVVTKLTNAEDFDPRVPTRVFAFSQGGAFQAFAPSTRVSGFFRPLLRENLVAVDASPGCEPRHVLFHEYTHFLVHNQDRPPVPRWYDEGFAELIATLRAQGDKVVVGEPPRYRGASPRLPLYKVMRARDLERFDDHERGLFYLQSWEIVHYLLIGPGREQGDVGSRLARYVRAVERGEDDEQAFSAAFGASFEGMEDAVEKYHAAYRLPALVPPRGAFEPAAQGTLRGMSAGEIAEQLGRLALSGEELELAERYFERALAADPTRARAHAGLADVYAQSGRESAAEPHYAQALSLAPGDFESHLDVAEALHRAAEKEGRTDRLPLARDHYARAIALAPGIPESHLMLAQTWLVPGEDPSAGIPHAERARALLPGHPMVHFALAQLYAKAGQRDLAIASARRSLLWSSERENDEAKALLASLLAEAPTATSD